MRSPKRNIPPRFSQYQPKLKKEFFSVKYWTTWSSFGALWLLAYIPQAWRVRLATVAGSLIYRYHKKRRDIVDLNLSWCFPDLSEEERNDLGKQCFRYLVQSILDTGVLWWRSTERVRKHIQFQGVEHLERELAEGRCVMVLSGHSPALEKGGVAMSMDYPMTSFTNESNNPLIEWMAARKRTRFGGYVFPRGGGFRNVIKAMRDGYGLYILTDEDLGADSAHFIPLFGIPKATLTTPLRLAKLTDAVILTSYTWYDDERSCYIMEFSPAMPNLTTFEEEESLALLNERLEAAIRKQPAQYMWSLRIFKTMYDGSPPPYYRRSKPGSGPRTRPEGL